YATGKDGHRHWITSSAVEIRDYDKLDDRDGMYFSLDETMKNYFRASGNNISAGISIFQDKTDARPYEYLGASCTVSGEATLPWNITLYSRVRYKTSEYAEKEALAPEKRSDTEYQAVLGLGRKTLKGWGIDLNHQYTHNDSTFGLYEYSRNVTTLSVNYLF
ncbi:unnamed protein product, partial [marine sediment metagenome]